VEVLVSDETQSEVAEALSAWEAWVLRQVLGACPECGIPTGYPHLLECGHDEIEEVAGC
jgi:hypothetical protein